MTKRRTHQPAKLRDRRSGQSPYRRHNKTAYRYDAMYSRHPHLAACRRGREK